MRFLIILTLITLMSMPCYAQTKKKSPDQKTKTVIVYRDRIPMKEIITACTEDHAFWTTINEKCVAAAANAYRSDK